MKVNQLKKMLSVTLAAAMLVTSIPLGSSAGETDATEATETTEATEAEKSEDVASKETAEETDATEATKATEATEAEKSEDTAPAETAGDTGAESKEVQGETTPAPSENAQDPSSTETVGQNTRSSAEESNGSNSAQEVSADNAQSAPQEGESASTPDNSTESTGEKKEENTPAKTSAFAPLELPGSTEVSVSWDPESLTKVWNGEEQEPTPVVEGDESNTVSLKYIYEAKDGQGLSTNGKPQEVGTYTVTVALEGEQSDITLNTTPATFTITKRQITELTWTCPESPVYTGNPITQPSATFKNINDEDTALTVTCVDSEVQPADITAIKDAGKYTLKAALSPKDEQHYSIAEGVATTKELEIKPCVVTLDWEDSTVTYDGTVQKITYTSVTHNAKCTDASTLENSIEIAYTKDGEVIDEDDIVAAGRYTATATLTDSNHVFADGSKTCTCTLTISKLGDITLTPKMPNDSKDLTKVYDNKKTVFSAYETTLEDPLKTELQELLGNVKESLFDYDSENADEDHPYSFKLSQDAIEALKDSNFDSSKITVAGTFTITKRPITITPNSGQSKYYGADDPVLTYVVDDLDDLNDTGIDETEIRNAIKGLFRTEGEDVGTYKIDVPNDAGNFTVKVSKEVTFEIKALPVTIIPDAGQGKLFGQEEPESYPYTVKIEESALTNKTNEDVEAVLGIYGLTRVQGEGIGQYNFQVVSEDSPYFKEEFDNYEFKVSDTPTFEIRPIEITDVQKINSRQDSFKVETDLTGDRQPGVTTGFKVEIVEYPEESDGINYSKNIDDYITDATSGVLFTGASDRIDINVVQYSKERKDNKKLVKWNGYLPAGTKIAVSVVDAYGNQVSNKKTVTVSPVTVSFDWSGYTTSAVTGNYLTENRGVVSPLTLTGSRTGEWAEIVYNGKAADYGELNLQFAPKAQNANSKHVTQTVTANIVDTLNLVCEPKSVQFYVDDSAFPIPASSIRFENRGKEIVIQLPEQGTLTEVSILDGKVELPGSMGQEFTLPVNWSGRNLIPSGAPISVTYTDQAGHQGTGITSASRSSVSTPITFRIRPELNMNGYLNGRSDMLIVSGTACSCEPIRITVAGSTQTTYATQKEVWSDSNGSWEAMFSMGALPEDQDFTISAEYVDVNGQGYSISAKFDAFCASPSVVSPVYEAMSYISGMVEPGTAVALVLNGDSQNYYEIQVDRFGHFVMDDVPMMFGGEDSFDIYVTDIAGNVSIRHYEVEEPGDPFEVTGKVNPLGKFLYSASENDSITLAATPVSADDFDENKADVEIPLLMGMSYEVGTLTLHKTASGFTVSKEIKVDEEIAAEDYRFENEKLYVYTSRPSVDELKSASGQEAAYGAEIPLGEGETVWIVSESDMTILADDVAELKQFDFENSEEYAKYQEK